MRQNKLRYSEFWHRINVDAFEEAIGFEVIEERNDNDVGYCLFPDNHANGDTTGKFGIHREKRVYNCFVCGGGDFLSLVVELRDCDVDEATEWLYQFCEDDTRSDDEFVDEFLASFEDVERRIETLPFFNERVLDKWMDYPPDEWLNERGISHDIAADYDLRFSDEVYRPSPKNGRFADDDPYVGPGIIFPHRWKDRLVGWQTRWLDDDRPEWVAKYTNTTDFPKETTIYGFEQALEADRPVLVMESVPSMLFVRSMGLPAVATFGSSINEPQLRLLRRFTAGVITAPDNDVPKSEGATPAGIKWQNSLTEYLKRYIPVWNLPPVEGKPGSDIGDIASNENSDMALWQYLDQAYQPGIDV